MGREEGMKEESGEEVEGEISHMWPSYMGIIIVTKYSFIELILLKRK